MSTRSAKTEEQGASCLLTLPTEIRLQIYSLLVLPQDPLDLVATIDKITLSTQDYFDYEKKQHGSNGRAATSLTRPTLLFRNIDPLRYQQRSATFLPEHVRSTYSVRCDRFRARTLETTYHCLNASHMGPEMSIMRTNKQIHAEVAELLYSTYTFDFDTHIEALVPFLTDLTPFARSCIKSLRIVKRALAYEKEFDRCEWSNAVQYLSHPEFGVNLRVLDLGIVAGRPGVTGWDGLATYSAADFDLLQDMEGLEWLRELTEIRNLQALDVEAVVEHCPPATSSRAMAGYVRFSASIESSLTAYLRGKMIQQ